MVRNRRRSIALKMVSAGLLTSLCFENMINQGFSVHVYAQDDILNDAISVAGNIFWSNPAISEAKNALISQYTSLDPYMVRVYEWELGAGYQLLEYGLQEAYAMENDFNFSHTLGGSYTATGQVKYSSGSVVYGLGHCSVSDNSLSFISDAGNIMVYAVGNLQSGGATSTREGSYLRLMMDYSGMPSGVDYQAWLSTSGVFDARNGLGVGRRGNFTFQYSCYVASDDPYNWAVLSSSNPQITWLSGTDNYGPYDLFDSFDIRGIILSFNAGEIYDIDSDPVGFLDKAKQKAVILYGQQAVDDYWIDVDLSDIPDMGELDSLVFPPGLPSVTFNDVELPSEPLPAKMVQGASFWFTQFSNMIDSLGVKYIVIIFLIIALIMAILKI